MNPSNLPLYYLYKALRRQGWVLGIDDYLTAVQLIESGMIIGNDAESDKELENLCGCLWAKSPQQKKTIEQICEQIRANYSIKLTEPETRQDDRKKNNKLSPSLPPQETPPPLPPRRQPKDYRSSFEKDPAEVAQCSLLGDRDSEDINSNRFYRFYQEYFPITERQMKQSWRSLRRLVREGKPVEIDIEATIQKISQEGLLTELILRPRRVNRADLILLVDQQGSMVPFHDLSRQLVETAQRGGKLRRADVYYFYNCPKESLFEQPNLFGRKSLTKTLESLDNRAVALIISDGGAARGHKDKDRIEQTKIFLKQLQKAVSYSAWLNPMPRKTWLGTSAEIFADLIPMYSLNRQEFNATISVLRGRPSNMVAKEG